MGANGVRWSDALRAAGLVLAGAVFATGSGRAPQGSTLGQVVLAQREDPRTPSDPVWQQFWVPIDQPARNHEMTSLILEWAGVRPGMHVADVGAGGGYFAVRFAEAARPEGLVWANDIDVRMVRKLAWERSRRGLYNLVPQLVDVGNLGLAQASLDLVTLVDVGLFTTCSEASHEDYVRQIASAVRPGGRWLMAGSVHGAEGERCPLVSPEQVVALASPWFERAQQREFTFRDGWRGYVTLLRRR